MQDDATSQPHAESSCRGGTLDLDDLAALNDEIVALVQAGLPLGEGLVHFARGRGRRLGATANRLAEAMQRGQSLEEAVAANAGIFPPEYRAVVLAGIETGRAGEALGVIASSARMLAETRRMVAVALSYPVLLVVMAWAGILFYVAVGVPRLLVFARDVGYLDPAMVQAIEANVVWLTWPPPLILVLIGAWVVLSSRAGGIASPRARMFFGWIPWLGALMQTLTRATMAELLQLQVAARVPIDRALVCAAEATGDLRVIRDATSVAEQVRRGKPLTTAMHGQMAGSELPELVQWALSSDGQDREKGPWIDSGLKYASEVYRRRATRLAERARRGVPILAAAIIGGGVTIYALLLLYWPWCAALEKLAMPAAGM